MSQTDVMPRAPFDAPPQLGTPQRSQRAIDHDLAKILAVSYAVFGVLYLLIGAATLPILIEGVRELLRNGEADTGFSVLFALAGVVVFALTAGLGAVNLLARKWINQRRNRTALFVIAAINCLVVPHGLFLGIATFVILSRDTMRDEFERSLPAGLQ